MSTHTSAGPAAPLASAGTQAAGPAAARRRPRTGVPSWVVTIVLAVAVLGLIELGNRQGFVSPLVLPAPSAVAYALWDGLSSGLFTRHILSTLGGTLAGFALATLAALTVAGVLSALPYVERVIMPFVVALQTLPKIAIAPLVILWLGFGFTGKLSVVVITCFFPILLNTLAGLRIRDRDAYQLLSSMGASRWDLFRYLRLPAAVPYIFAGLHIGILFALIGAVTSEFVGSRAGLGYVLLQNKAAFNVPGVFAVLVLFMIIGLALNLIMRLAERRIAFWSRDLTQHAV